MSYSEDSEQPGSYRYKVNRYPYVEVDHAGELFHAHAWGQKDNMVMIAKPKGQLQRWTTAPEKHSAFQHHPAHVSAVMTPHG